MRVLDKMIWKVRLNPFCLVLHREFFPWVDDGLYTGPYRLVDVYGFEIGYDPHRQCQAVQLHWGERTWGFSVLFKWL